MITKRKYKPSVKIEFGNRIIDEMNDYRGNAIVCDSEDHIENCPDCERIREGIEGCIGIVRSLMHGE